MGGYDNAYSRFIALAKIVLPLAALGILSTVFLVSRENTRQVSEVPRSDVDVLLREQRLSAPNYAGVTSDGTAIAMTADSAQRDPETEGRMIAEPVRARLDLPDGSQVDIASRRGTLDRGESRVVLEGDARLVTSTGYSLASERLTASLDRTDIASDVPVTGHGPPGHLKAGSMRLREDPETPGQYLLVFKGGVKLIYDPEN